MRTNLLALIFGGLVVCGGKVFAQSESVWTTSRCEQLQASLLQLHENKRFNGTVLIAENGVVKFHKSYGYSNPLQATKFDDQSSFRLASVSKQFTAMAIMILKQRGKLDYDEPITKYLPTLPYENVTLRHLLHHTSGLPDYMGLMNKHWDRHDSERQIKKFSDRKIASNQDAVAMFAKHKPKLEFEPGSRFAYSNTGYVFLGQIIENASGIPVREFLIKSILKPLKMKNSSVFSPEDNFKLEHRVFGFRHVSNSTQYQSNDHHYLNGMVGDGGVYASALDLLKWDQALYGEQLVSQATIAEAFTPGRLPDGSETGYGFGWSIAGKPTTGRFQVSHSGGWVGFSTFIARNISQRRTLIILDNSSSGINSVLAKVSEVKNSSH